MTQSPFQFPNCTFTITPICIKRNFIKKGTLRSYWIKEQQKHLLFLDRSSWEQKQHLDKLFYPPALAPCEILYNFQNSLQMGEKRAMKCSHSGTSENVLIYVNLGMFPSQLSEPNGNNFEHSLSFPLFNLNKLQQLLKGSIH